MQQQTLAYDKAGEMLIKIAVIRINIFLMD